MKNATILYKKIILTLIVTTVAFISFNFAMASNISAQSVTCRPGTNVPGIPCDPIVVNDTNTPITTTSNGTTVNQTQVTNCPNPGPYGFCTPDTSIFNADGSINTGTLVLVSSTFILGFVFLFMGMDLKRRVEKKY